MSHETRSHEPPAPRLVFIGSTGGGVLSRVASHAFVRHMALEAVSDRPCGFLDVAAHNGIPAICLPAADGATFSDLLAARYGGRGDIVFLSFYTRLFRGAFLAAQRGRILNFHPSLLPAFPGMHGFEDTLASGSLFMGCSVHEVDAGIDTGPCLLQAALPLDRRLPVAQNRHRLFLAQVYSALQLIRWLGGQRLCQGPEGRWTLTGAAFGPGSFAPNLDADFFDFIGEADALANPAG